MRDPFQNAVCMLELDFPAASGTAHAMRVHRIALDPRFRFENVVTFPDWQVERRVGVGELLYDEEEGVRDAEVDDADRPFEGMELLRGELCLWELGYSRRHVASEDAV